MFNSIFSLGKAVVGTVLLPVNLVADIVTLGGSITDKDEPYTAKAVSNILTNLDKSVKPLYE